MPAPASCGPRSGRPPNADHARPGRPKRHRRSTMALPPALAPMPSTVPTTGRSTVPGALPAGRRRARCARRPAPVARTVRQRPGSPRRPRAMQPRRSRRHSEVQRDPRAGGTRKGRRAPPGVTGNAVAADNRCDRRFHRPAPGQRSGQGSQRARVSPGGVDENRAIPRRNRHRTGGRWVQTEAPAQVAASVTSHYQHAHSVASRQSAGFSECALQPGSGRRVPSRRDPGRRRKPRGPLSGGALPGRVGSGPQQPTRPLPSSTSTFTSNTSATTRTASAGRSERSGRRSRTLRRQQAGGEVADV